MRLSWLLLMELLLSEPVEVEARRRSGLDPKAPVAAEAAATSPLKGLARTYAKSVSVAPGADGHLHTLVRETRASEVGTGADAQVTGVVRECKDGKCEDWKITSAEDVEHHLSGNWLPHFSPFGRLMSPPSFRPFALDEFPSVGDYGWSWLDESPSFFAMPRLHSWMSDTGMHMRPDDVADTGAQGPDEAEQLAQKTLKKDEAHSEGDKEEADDATVKASGGDLAPPKVRRERVTRTIIITDVDGKRERREVVERCVDGKCTKEEHRPISAEERGIPETQERMEPVLAP